jgi:Fe-S cluster assembly protein SufD
VTIAPPLDLSPRIASLDPDQFEIPAGREEEWRFVPIDHVQAFFHPQADAGSVNADPAEFTSVIPIDQLKDDWLPTDRPAAIARAHTSQAIFVDVPSNVVVDEPIVLHLRNSAAMNYGHIFVQTGAHSSATVIIEHDITSNVAGAIVTHVGDGASLTLVNVVEQGDGQAMLQWHNRVGRDASLTGASVILDGSFVRILPTVTYAGPGGNADLYGVFLADGHQFYEQRIFVEHVAPHCRSNVIYKGALSGAHAHTVWIGDVLVRRTAIGTDTYEMNRNLLLTDGPRADSVPNLELETGDVASAGHASATGRFDDLQLFYLMSRGLTEEQARQMVVRGFFSDVIRRVPSVQWQEQLQSRVDRRLGMVTEDE